MEPKSAPSPKPAAREASPVAKDRRIPLSFIEFSKPIALDGFIAMFRRLTKGEKPDQDVDKVCPKMFFDPDLQCVIVGEDHIPLAWVNRYHRAKAA